MQSEAGWGVESQGNQVLSTALEERMKENQSWHLVYETNWRAVWVTTAVSKVCDNVAHTAGVMWDLATEDSFLHWLPSSVPSLWPSGGSGPTTSYCWIIKGVCLQPISNFPGTVSVHMSGSEKEITHSSLTVSGRGLAELPCVYQQLSVYWRTVDRL